MGFVLFSSSQIPVREELKEIRQVGNHVFMGYTLHVNTAPLPVLDVRESPLELMKMNDPFFHHLLRNGVLVELRMSDPSCHHLERYNDLINTKAHQMLQPYIHLQYG